MGTVNAIWNLVVGTIPLLVPGQAALLWFEGPFNGPDKHIVRSTGSVILGIGIIP
jgi:hypothetical protein